MTLRGGILRNGDIMNDGRRHLAVPMNDLRCGKFRAYGVGCQADAQRNVSGQVDDKQENKDHSGEKRCF